MHYANCNTFNADFDGDEINLHLPQELVARAEGYEIVQAEHQYIVPTSGNPVRGLIQVCPAPSHLHPPSPSRLPPQPLCCPPVATQTYPLLQYDKLAFRASLLPCFQMVLAVVPGQSSVVPFLDCSLVCTFLIPRMLSGFFGLGKDWLSQHACPPGSEAYQCHGHVLQHRNMERCAKLFAAGKLRYSATKRRDGERGAGSCGGRRAADQDGHLPHPLRI